MNDRQAELAARIATAMARVAEVAPKEPPKKKKNKARAARAKQAGRVAKQAERVKVSRSRARERFARGEIEIVHGPSGYNYWGCRCDVCKTAQGVRMKEYDAERKAKARADQLTIGQDA